MGETYLRILPHFYLRRDKQLIADEVRFAGWCRVTSADAASCPAKQIILFFARWAASRSKSTSGLWTRKVGTGRLLVTNDPDVAFILRSNEQCDCVSERT